MRSLVAFALLLAVVGCATQAQQEVSRMKEASAAVDAESKACWARLDAAEEFQSLKAKMPPTDGSPPSIELQANQTKPTTADAALLIDLHKNYIVPCRKITLDGMTKVNGAFAAVYARSSADADAEYVKLVKREETWGEFAVAAARRRAATQQAMRDAATELNRDLARSHASEVQQRQAAASAMSQMLYQQQVIAAMNRPVTTNCMRTGGYLNCTSY